MYKKDLSIGRDNFGNEVIYIGWLDSTYKFKQKKNQDFLFLLWNYYKYKINICRGFHRCNYCGIFNNYIFNKKVPTIKYNNEIIQVGFYDIIILDKEERIYIAPSLIFHYIEKHNYYPPKEFINAVYNGIDPSSYKYCQLLKKYKYIE